MILASRGGKNSKEKSGPSARFGFDPNATAVPLDDFLADGQADPGAGIILLSVQALEESENALRVAALDANAVVANGEQPVRFFRACFDVNSRRRTSIELDGVTQKVFKQADE